MRRTAAILVATLLASCATAPKKDVQIQVVEKLVPVREKCPLAVPAEPEWANKGVDLAALDIFGRTKIALAVIQQAFAYQAELRAVAEGCTQ